MALLVIGIVIGVMVLSYVAWLLVERYMGRRRRK